MRSVQNLLKKRTFRFASSRGFTLIEIMIALVIVGIVAAFATQAILNNQKGSRKNEFDNEVNAAMAELTRLVSNPETCFASFHDLGPRVLFSDPRSTWTQVPYFIYDATASPLTGPTNLISFNFPQTVSGPPPAFRNSKILGIRSVYLVPMDYPNYPMQMQLGGDRTGNAFIEITFEYIGPENTMFGTRTRTKMLPLSVTWTKTFQNIPGTSLSEAAMLCQQFATQLNCQPDACIGTISGDCQPSNNSLDLLLCPCSIYQASYENWRVDQCNAIGISGT